MSDTARSDLLVFIGAALATTIGLFVLHTWYGTFLDQRFHASLAKAEPSEALLQARSEEEKALESGKIPLPQAIDALAQRGRTNVGSIAPKPSTDLSAVAGWVHKPGFKPVTAFPVRVPAAAKPVETAPASPIEAAPAPAAPEAVPAAPAAPKKAAKAPKAAAQPAAAQAR